MNIFIIMHREIGNHFIAFKSYHSFQSTLMGENKQYGLFKIRIQHIFNGLVVFKGTYSARVKYANDAHNGCDGVNIYPSYCKEDEAKKKNERTK